MSLPLDYPEMYPSILLDFANRKALDSRLSFSRASTGRYYDGVTVAKAEENLFTRSQEFDQNSWNKARTTVTANSTTAPDGTATADTIYETADTNTHYVNQGYTPNGAAQTISVYAKGGLGRDWLWVRTITSGPTERTAYFDIATGAVGTVGAGLTATITDVGNSWYRCVVSTTNSSTTVDAWGFGPASANGTNNYAGDITKGVYLWGAQLEQRAVATAYTATTTQPITKYQQALQATSVNVPRFDHDPVTGQSLGLLIENQSTNLVLRSQEFDNAVWTKARSSIIANAAISPDGTLTAVKLIADTQANPHFVSQSPAIATGTVVTGSCYVKAGEWDSVGLFRSSDSTIGVNFNLSTASASVAVGSPIAFSITSVGNGWYRLTMTYTTVGATNDGMQVRIGISGNFGASGNGFNGIYIWGAQLETQSYATSYIGTAGSQVTRSRDLCSGYWFNFLNLSEGSYFLEYDAPAALAGDYKVMSAYGDIYARKGTDYNQLYMDSSLYASAGYYSASRNKLAMSYTNTTAAAAANQMPTASDTGNISTRGDYHMPLTFSTSTAADSGVSTHIAKFAYYPKALTNYQLQALTI